MAAYQTTIAGINLEIHEMADNSFTMSWGGNTESLCADRLEEAKLAACRIVYQILRQGILELRNLEFKTLYGEQQPVGMSSVAMA